MPNHISDGKNSFQEKFTKYTRNSGTLGNSWNGLKNHMGELVRQPCYDSLKISLTLSLSLSPCQTFFKLRLQAEMMLEMLGRRRRKLWNLFCILISDFVQRHHSLTIWAKHLFNTPRSGYSSILVGTLVDQLRSSRRSLELKSSDRKAKQTKEKKVIKFFRYRSAKELWNLLVESFY